MKVTTVFFCVALVCGIVFGGDIHVEGTVKQLGEKSNASLKHGAGFAEGHLPHGGVTQRPMKKIRRPIAEREERIKRQDYYYYYYYY